MPKTPEQCLTLDEVRDEIDRLDHMIISTLGERFAYVRAAAAFKKSPVEIAAPERVARMMAQRRVWAREAGLDPDVIEKVYRELIAYFTTEETKHKTSGP